MADLDILGVVPEVKQYVDELAGRLSAAGHGLRWHEASLSEKLAQAHADGVAGAQPTQVAGPASAASSGP